MALTAFVRDLKLAHPEVSVQVEATGAEPLLAYNPYVSKDNGDATLVALDYRGAIAECARTNPQIHYLGEYYRDFARKYGVEIPMTEPRPDLHLAPTERDNPRYPYRYWVVIAGHKSDMPTKAWSAERFQAVVDKTGKEGYRWIQLGGRTSGRIKHTHFPLHGVANLVGQTDLRQFLTLIYHSAGVLCGATMAMLVAAAFWKPCVCIAAGRESWYWLSFSRDNPAWGSLADKIVTPHRCLSTIGRLDCCLKAPCNARQLKAPHNDSEFPEGFLCKRPVEEGRQTLPECMRMITVDDVVAAIRSYERT